MISERSDAELATCAREGHRGAFDWLVARYKAQTFRFIRGYVGNAEDAHDLVQDTFVAVWLTLKRFDPERDFAAWLKTIALNKCRDFSRRQAVRRRFLRQYALERQVQIPIARHLDASVQEEREDHLTRLELAMAGLPPFYKEPLLLTAIRGLSQAAVANQLNTTTKAIEMRTRRARKKLVDSLHTGMAAE
jgi:RNA polymerase sigma factor CnrH